MLDCRYGIGPLVILSTYSANTIWYMLSAIESLVLVIDCDFITSIYLILYIAVMVPLSNNVYIRVGL